MRKMISILMVLCLVFTLSACDEFFKKVPPTDVCKNNAPPVLENVEDVILEVGMTFDENQSTIKAFDAEDGDLTSDIVVEGEVDLNQDGGYSLTYSVTDSCGATTTASRTVTIKDVDLVYPTGLYNYKFADTELRHTFVAAAEKWLLENQVGGIPLFASGSFNMYSHRTVLPVEDYVAVLGYGEEFGTFSNDDSTVKMYDGNPGNVGEYTYRTRASISPMTFNQWLYDTSTDSDYLDKVYGSLYSYEFNADKTGYEVNPSMAAGNPVAVDSRITENGKEVSYTWEISLRDDLEFFFHPDITTQNGFDPDDYNNAITTEDYINTFKLALESDWFRAVSGGGDFYYSIEGAKEYVDGTGDWADVGFNIVDDYTMEFTFTNEQSEWNVRYFFSSFVMSPISLELYDYLENHKVNGNNPYGTNEYNVGYHGPYYVHENQEDIVVRMKENTNYHDPNKYFYTGFDFLIQPDASIGFQMFLDDKLDVSGAPTSSIDTYYGDSRLYKVPGATTYKLMINSLKTEEAQRELFPDGTWIPEPLLGNDEFKDAMFFAIDRQELAEDILRVRTTNMYYFSTAYMFDAEIGVPYRNTEQGQSVGVNMFPETHGYNYDESVKLFKKALDDLIDEGMYQEGTSDNWNVITIELNSYSNSPSWDLATDYIKDSFEDTFIYPEKFIKVEVDVYTKDFPAIYYNYMMIGEFDLSVGGISACTLCGGGLALDDYSSDNRSGFFLNPGVDTSKAEIEVIYSDLDGIRHREMWSFDAIASVLEGDIYIFEGEEGEVPIATDIEVTETTLDFVVSEFENDSFINITYTLEYYDFEYDRYNVVEGYENVPATTKEISITGLTPYNFGLNENGEIVYEGDYQITINYNFRGSEGADKSSIAPWFEMKSLVVHDEPIVTDIMVDIDNIVVNNSDGIIRTVISYELFEEQTDGNFTSFLKTDMELPNQVMINGLTPETNYVFKITFDNGEIHYLHFETEKPAT